MELCHKYDFKYLNNNLIIHSFVYKLIYDVQQTEKQFYLNYFYLINSNKIEFYRKNWNLLFLIKYGSERQVSVGN